MSQIKTTDDVYRSSKRASSRDWEGGVGDEISLQGGVGSDGRLLNSSPDEEGLFGDRCCQDLSFCELVLSPASFFHILGGDNDDRTGPQKWRRKAGESKSGAVAVRTSGQEDKETAMPTTKVKKSPNNLKTPAHGHSSSSSPRADTMQDWTSLHLDNLHLFDLLRIDEDEGEGAKKITLKQHQFRKKKFFKMFPDTIVSKPLALTYFSSGVDHWILASDIYDRMKSEMITEWSKSSADLTKPLLVLFAFEIHQQACKIYSKKWRELKNEDSDKKPEKLLSAAWLRCLQHFHDTHQKVHDSIEKMVQQWKRFSSKRRQVQVPAPVQDQGEEARHEDQVTQIQALERQIQDQVTQIQAFKRSEQDQVAKLQALERQIQDQRTEINLYESKVQWQALEIDRLTQAQVSTLEKPENVQEETQKLNIQEDDSHKTKAVEISTTVQRSKTGKVIIVTWAASKKKRRGPGVGGEVNFDARSVRFETLTFTKTYTIAEANQKEGVKRAIMLDLLSRPELTDYVDEIQRFI
jgi:hypothetical protein